MDAEAIDTARPGFAHALPFWASLGLVPLAVAVTALGSWWILLIPASTWLLFAGLDAVLGHDRTDISPEAPDSALFWHRMITLVWTT